MNYKKISGLLMMISAIIIALYVGGWLMFVGGIIQVIKEIRAVELSMWNVAIGIIKVIFAGFTGTVTALFLWIPGQVLWEQS